MRRLDLTVTRYLAGGSVACETQRRSSASADFVAATPVAVWHINAKAAMSRPLGLLGGTT